MNEDRAIVYVHNFGDNWSYSDAMQTIEAHMNLTQIQTAQLLQAWSLLRDARASLQYAKQQGVVVSDALLDALALFNDDMRQMLGGGKDAA